MRIFQVILACMIVLSGCSKSEKAPSPTIASIIGSVNLYDEGTNSLPNEGMTVSVEGLNTAITATTDRDGKFTLLNVPFGTYTLVYSKEGYGTYKRMNVAHQSNNLGYTYLSDQVSLGKISSTSITGLAAEVVGDNVVITINTDGDLNRRRYIRRFYHNTPAVSSLIATVDNGVSVLLPYSNQAIITKAELQALNFTTGMPLWIRVYGDSFWSNYYVESGNSLYPNLNPSTVDAVMVTVP